LNSQALCGVSFARVVDDSGLRCSVSSPISPSRQPSTGHNTRSKNVRAVHWIIFDCARVPFSVGGSVFLERGAVASTAPRGTLVSAAPKPPLGGARSASDFRPRRRSPNGGAREHTQTPRAGDPGGAAEKTLLGGDGWASRSSLEPKNRRAWLARGVGRASQSPRGPSSTQRRVPTSDARSAGLPSEVLAAQMAEGCLPLRQPVGSCPV